MWLLDAPVDRIAVANVAMSHYPVVVAAVLPDLERIARRIENLLPT